jgi:cation diffusion facilitator CzcD-associated flavoprotein CzcO
MRFLPPSSSTRHDVLIVGAGPAGLGCAVALKACGLENLAILDRRGVGAAFEHWPAQMRMITPSFHSNPFGQVDLNAITPQTSPADFLGREHPSGLEYARYLRAVADFYRFPVESGVEVISVKKKGREFAVETSEGRRRARFVIWAAGEFFQPHRGDITGADLCLHNSEVDDWSELPGVEHALIGGFESGIDAAVHLAQAGKSVHVFSRGEPWHSDHSDPSRTLTPYTRDRLKAAFLEAPGSIRFYKNADIVEVKSLGDRYVLLDREGVPFEVSTPPILCTGFRGALRGVEEHFHLFDEEPVFTEEADESPVTEGLFYSGPALRHRGTLFCFIYKFRARFGIVASEIASRLGLEWEGPLKLWRERGFLVEDLACCTDCRCDVRSEAGTAEAEDYREARGRKGNPVMTRK